MKTFLLNILKAIEACDKLGDTNIGYRVFLELNSEIQYQLKEAMNNGELKMVESDFYDLLAEIDNDDYDEAIKIVERYL